MYDIKYIRRTNMLQLAKVAGGITNLAEKLGKSQSQISQLIGRNPSKNIGDKIARQVERTFGKPRGWMDILHNTVDENITAYELVKSAAPHRPVPLISWEAANLSLPITQLAASSQQDILVPGSAKLGVDAFALRLKDIDAEKCPAFALHSQAILFIDPTKEPYSGAYVITYAIHSERAVLRQIHVEGGRTYLKTMKNDAPLEPLPLDWQLAVVRGMMVDFD